eukprot:superscaffoldBa00002092_g13138
MQSNTAARLAAHVPLIFLTSRQMKEAQQRLLSVLTAPVTAAACCAAGPGGAASTSIHQAVWSGIPCTPSRSPPSTPPPLPFPSLLGIKHVCMGNYQARLVCSLFRQIVQSCVVMAVQAVTPSPLKAGCMTPNQHNHIPRLQLVQDLKQVLGGSEELTDGWVTTAEVMKETARKVLGVSSGQRKEDKETWWWNEEVQESIWRTRLVKKKWDSQRDEESRKECKEMRHKAKGEAVKAKEKAYGEWYERLDTKEREKDLY